MSLLKVNTDFHIYFDWERKPALYQVQIKEGLTKYCQDIIYETILSQNLGQLLHFCSRFSCSPLAFESSGEQVVMGKHRHKILLFLLFFFSLCSQKSKHNKAEQIAVLHS